MDDDDDCDNDGVRDVVVRATSERDTEGEIVVLNRTTPHGDEYRGEVTVSALSDSPGVVFVSQIGEQTPTMTVTYLDQEDGTGRLCQNDVVPSNQGRISASTSVLLLTCDVSVVSTSYSDNGDGDEFADSDETVTLDFTVQNNCGVGLTDCVARLSTNSPAIECIQTSFVGLGDLPAVEPVPTPEPFVFKVDGTLGDRELQGLTPEDPFSAEFNIAIGCNEIDGTLVPQSFSVELDLNVSDFGQTPVTWFEGFEGGLGKFTPQNLDAGLSGTNNIEGLMNGDGWRCQYTDPDWVNGGSYGQDEALNCFPTHNLAQANAVFWQLDGSDVPTSPDGGRAKSGLSSMYYGVFYAVPNNLFTTPQSVVESAYTPNPINLGLRQPQLSFWHQISLFDHRYLSNPDRRSADRGVVQVQLADAAGNPSSDWMNLQPTQNAYDEQGADNFFNCMFDPVDDGNNEDDFFDPTDPAREFGPSSTCFPEFAWAYMGSVEGPFNPSNTGHATTPPQPSDAPSLGVGTWVETRVDLSAFRGRRARIRYIVTSIKGSAEVQAEQFGEPGTGITDDGWWIDDVTIDDVLVIPAGIQNDLFMLGTCSSSQQPCIGQCSASLASCSATDPCGAGEGDCVAPCPEGETCSGPPPECGPICTEVTANVFVEPDEVLNPGSVSTLAPGRLVNFNAAAPLDPETGAQPSSADACQGGVLQFRYCISGDPDGGGPGEPDADCEDPSVDAILRSWTTNPVFTAAPQSTASYVVEVRCSTAPDCLDSEKVEVIVSCPGGVNALGLADMRASDKMTLVWTGSLDVDWLRGSFVNSPDIGNYVPDFTDFTASTDTIPMTDVPNPGMGHYYLVKADGELNTIPTGYFCNSRTWRSGGASEKAESARDAAFGDP